MMTVTDFSKFHSPFSGHWVRERAGTLLTYRPRWPIAVLTLVVLAVLAVVLLRRPTAAGTMGFVAAAVILGALAAFTLAWCDEYLIHFDRRLFVHRKGFAWSPRTVELPLDSLEAVVVELRRAVRPRRGEVVGIDHCIVVLHFADREETFAVWSHTDSERVVAFARLLAERVGVPMRDERPEDVLEAERIWRQEMARLLGETDEGPKESTGGG